MTALGILRQAKAEFEPDHLLTAGYELLRSSGVTAQSSNRLTVRLLNARAQQIRDLARQAI
jgi:hypothetical protein